MKKEYLDQLAAALCAHMPEETILVCGSRAEGKRILSALAAQGRILVGVRAETPFSLARELCETWLSLPGTPPLLQEADGAELVRSCMDQHAGIYSSTNARTLTATKAIFRTFQELSMAGYSDDVQTLPPVRNQEKLQELMRLRKAYIDRKRALNRMDRGDLFRMALIAAGKGPSLARAHYVALGEYAPALLERQLLDQLTARNGLTVVKLPCAAGVELPAGALAETLPRENVAETLRKTPPVCVACRGTETEVRYVLRDILEKQRKLEDCAVVYLNGRYAQMLYEEADRFHLPVSMGGGLPMTGSLLYTTLQKVWELPQTDFYAENVCDLLESFSCTPMWPAKLAERLRQKKIGWGRDRYGMVWDSEDADTVRDKRMTDEAWAATLADWRKFLELLLAVTAPSGTLERQKQDVVDFLAYCSRRPLSEIAAVAKAEELVSQIIGLDSGETVLQRLLSLMQSAAYLSHQPEPGKLHCAPLSDAVCLNRKYVYMIGFSRYALRGTQRESPILLDEERKAIGGLKTSEQLGCEREFRLLTLLLRCGAELVLTYPDFDSSKMLDLSPPPFLEEVSGGTMLRMTYLLPGRRTAVDHLLQTEVIDRISWAKPWNPATASEEVVPATLQAKKTRKDLLEEMSLSSSALEKALKCPYDFYLSAMLHIRKPQRVERNDQKWLQTNEIGTFCHDVLEKYYAQGEADLLDRFFDQAFEELKVQIPMPHPSMEEENREILWNIVQRAVEWTQTNGRTVVATEKKFPRKDGDPGIPMTFGQWNLKLRGSIDRVDQLSTGEYAILDYKTGRPENYTDALYRHWQPYLYALAEEQMSGKPDSITHAGYLFLQSDAALVELDMNKNLREETAARIEWLLDRISDEDYEPEQAPDFRPEQFVSGSAVTLLEPGNHREAVKQCANYCEFADICPAQQKNKKGGR